MPRSRTASTEAGGGGRGQVSNRGRAGGRARSRPCRQAVGRAGLQAGGRGRSVGRADGLAGRQAGERAGGQAGECVCGRAAGRAGDFMHIDAGCLF